MSTVRSDDDRVAYSPTEVARRLGCTRQHVQNLIARGEIPSMKLGRRRLIPRSFVDQFGEPGPHAAA
jgi:excisionase family DNA binding protein